MEKVTDARINELLTTIAGKMAIDVETCPESSLKKILLMLKVFKAQRVINCTDEEYQAVKDELSAFN
jgi:hypothetical protein